MRFAAGGDALIWEAADDESSLVLVDYDLAGHLLRSSAFAVPAAFAISGALSPMPDGGVALQGSVNPAPGGTFDIAGSTLDASTQSFSFIARLSPGTTGTP
ncbi:MAG TPA: hypothetical protein VGM56_13690 [Byssovorax sp.]